VTRVAREVGTEGKLGGQAEVRGVSGTWKDLTDNVNYMAGSLTSQVRNIAQVTTAVARGDLGQKITVDVKGEMLELKNTINTMVDQLSSFADEVTRVAREVGTEGKLGGQAQVKGVSGTWRDLTENVNYMAGNLTGQVRNIAGVTTAVANGDLTKKITVDARGEILELKSTINTMVDQLSSFGAEVTRVAREVGTEGKLGGQAQVKGVSGTWRDLTQNVNQLATTLTTQLRAIAEVSTAVTQGDLTRQITVEAEGEVAELKDNINQMIENLRDTTQKNAEQDWLKTNLAKISGMMQGQRDLQTVSRLIMSELTPTVSAQHGAFFLADGTDEGDEHELNLVASYGYKARKSVANRFKVGEGLVGQAALEKAPILITEAPPDYIRVSSGLGEAAPVNIIVLPLLFEEQTLGVIELGALRPFTEVNQTFLEQVTETIGVVLNTIIANMRTEELLAQSQRLTQELQSQSVELQQQQEELRRSNSELESQAASLKASEELLQQQQEELRQTNDELQEKARLLAEQNRSIEVKNREIEMARLSLEEKAEQLALSSKYKSEFLANMSHELRTPLNSLLILARLLSDNEEATLTDKQTEYARTIHAAGSDLLDLINDILDLSKVEAGKMDVVVSGVRFEDVQGYVEQAFRPVAAQKGLDFTIELAPGLPNHINTDEQRLQQVLKNLLSNAMKFTDEGAVALRMEVAPDGTAFREPTLIDSGRVIAFRVADTGSGIPADKLMLIFEAFQQADGTTSRRYGGTGLGLSISREIARLLGGEIHVESTPGEGSVFTLYLPETFTPRPGANVAALAARATVDQDAVEALGEDEVADDREDLGTGDRRLLVIGADPELERIALDVGRAQGFKVLVAARAGAGLAMAREFRPDAVLLDADLEHADGAAVLTHFKQEIDLRHIPVQVCSARGGRHMLLRAGAFGYADKPVTPEQLAAALERIVAFADRGTRRVLVVEDDEVQRQAVAELIGGGDDVEVVGVGSSEEALEALAGDPFDCVVLDLKLPKTTGFSLLERIKSDEGFADLPVIVYTGKELTKREETRLRKYAETIIVKDARSPERLLDETALFLHRPEARLPVEKRRMIEELHAGEDAFAGKRVLIVDDDVRNVFALTSVLERVGVEVLFAENGQDGLALLQEHPDVDLVLMDIMMPEMDGNETTAAIRRIPELAELPIIALTAKAMKGDREKSVAAGASDYITKPVNVDQLLSLMRVWLYRQTPTRTED
jgi:signal transduction histidine kinase/DNA-binding response OmpR family regulator/HAMP domain-containing protein